MRIDHRPSVEDRISSRLVDVSETLTEGLSTKRLTWWSTTSSKKRTGPTSDRTYWDYSFSVQGGGTLLPALDVQTGLLPLGRYSATLDDIKEHYVDAPRFAESNSRAEIWQHFDSATQGIRSVVPVVCVWIGGSFLTDKLDPDDIDLVYWCEDVLVDRVTDPQAQLLLQLFAQNQVRAQTGLRVDTRYCRWHVDPEADQGASDKHKSYVLHRGFWDDFWMRKRSGAKGDAPQRADALPKRGYFEVPLDGFHVI